MAVLCQVCRQPVTMIVGTRTPWPVRRAGVLGQLLDLIWGRRALITPSIGVCARHEWVYVVAAVVTEGDAAGANVSVSYKLPRTQAQGLAIEEVAVSPGGGKAVETGQ